MIRSITIKTADPKAISSDSRAIRKYAYKYAAVILWHANALLDDWTYRGRYTAPRNAIQRALKARQQAGRIITAIGNDEQLADALRRYEPDLEDFEADFSAGLL